MMINAVAEDLPCTSDLITSISDYFSQVRRRLDDGTSGPEAFQLLLRLLADHFDTSDSESGFLRLQKFTVPKGTFFSVYLRSFRLLVSSVAGSERTLAPSMGMILEIVRSSVMKQFPSLAPTLFPGLLATAVTPFVSVSAMWESFSALATNQTPALAGVDHFSSVHTQGSSQPQRSHRSSGFSNHGGHGSQRNPIVLPVSAQDSPYDPFTSDYASWPAHQDDWATVYSITSGYKNLNGNPVLYTALLTQEQRNHAFRDHRNKCLNCSGSDHSMKTCRSPFTNSSGLLNPDLGLLQDNSEAFRRWQRRLASARLHANPAGSGKSNNRHKNGGRSNRRRGGNKRNNGYSRNNYSGGNNAQQSTELALRSQQQVGAPDPPSGDMVAHNPNSRQPGNFSSGGQNGSNRG